MRRLSLLLAVVACRGPDDLGIEPADARVQTSGVLRCEVDPALARFERTTIGDDWPEPERDGQEGAGGIVVADLDGDGYHDLVIPLATEPTQLWLWDPASSGFVPSARPLPAVDDVTGGSAADADGDGDLDVVLVRFESPAVLLVNDGTASFELRQLEPSDDPFVGCGGTASWADFDLDGDLDLFLGRLVFRRLDHSIDLCDSRMFVNGGGLDLVDHPELLSDDVHTAKVFASGWTQLDADPWPELYTANDFMPEGLMPNRVLDNDGGRLVQANGHSLNTAIASMGLALGDWNEDGVVDAVVPGTFELRAMRSVGDSGVWVDAAHAIDAWPDRQDGQASGWGGELVNLDNDTRVDLLMSYGPQNGAYRDEDAYPEQPDELYLQGPDGSFTRAGASWGIDDPSKSRGSVSVDLDRNGALDIVKREFEGRVTVDLQACRSEGWLIVRLHDETANPDAVGAAVRVQVDGRTLHREVGAGSTSFQSGGPPEVHIGLGAYDVVEGLEVTWPDGEVSSYPGLETRQVVDLWR